MRGAYLSKDSVKVVEKCRKNVSGEEMVRYCDSAKVGGDDY